MVTTISDTSEPWDTIDFAEHLYLGRGLAVTLSSCGHLSGIIDYYFYNIYREGKSTYDRVNDQIIRAARAEDEGSFYYDFNSSYPEFGNYFWIFGGGVVEGFFTGTLKREKGMMQINGKVYYKYSDEFTDILSIREKLRGSSDPDAAYWLERLITDGFGSYFPITGYWETTFRADVKVDLSASIYH